MPIKPKWGSKEFAFKEIFKCGSCRANITAEEKHKPLKNGTYKRHAYYRCTRQVDRNCREKPINETDLKEETLRFISDNDKNIKVSNELRSKIDKHFVLVKYVLKKHSMEEKKNVKPLLEYASYVLESCSYAAQGDFIRNIESEFYIKEKAIEVTS